jgi:hypothetical protein
VPTAQAHIPTDRASRYLVQLCKHGSQMGMRALHQPRSHGDAGPPKVRHAEWTDTEGIIDFGGGRCSIKATDERLTLLAEGDDQQHLQRIQDGIAGRLERIGRRDQLTVTWQKTQPTTPPPGQTNDPPPAPEQKAAAHRRHLGTAALAAVAALVIAVHLGLAEALLANFQRAGWVFGGVLVLVVVKVLIVGRFALHRRRPSQGNGNRR